MTSLHTGFEGYCMRCRAVRMIVGAETKRMKNRRLAVAGQCSVCHTAIYRLGPGATSPLSVNADGSPIGTAESGEEINATVPTDTIEYCPKCGLSNIVPDAYGRRCIACGMRVLDTE